MTLTAVSLLFKNVSIVYQHNAEILYINIFCWTDFSIIIYDTPSVAVKDDSQIFTFSIRNWRYKWIYKYICSNNNILYALFRFKKITFKT